MSVPRTALRERYELIQERGVDRQTRECVDYLENPEVFMAEFVDSYRAMERFAASGRRMPRGASPDPKRGAHLLELSRDQLEPPGKRIAADHRRAQRSHSRPSSFPAVAQRRAARRACSS